MIGNNAKYALYLDVLATGAIGVDGIGAGDAAGTILGVVLMYIIRNRKKVFAKLKKHFKVFFNLIFYIMKFDLDLNKKYTLFGVEVSLLTIIMSVIFLVILYGVLTRTSESFGSCKSASTSYSTVESSDHEHHNNDNHHHHDHAHPDTIQSTESNQIDSNDSVKIYNFNTNWCGHSRNFQGEWSKLMDLVNTDEQQIAFDVKCDDKENLASQHLCEKYRDHVPGFPSVLFVINEDKDNQQIIEYGKNENEGRSADMIKNKLDSIMN